MSWSETVYLRTATAEELTAALDAAGWGARFTATHAVDIVGVIYAPTGETTTDSETGEETPVMAPVAGCHANVRLRGEALPEALASYVIDKPDTPDRVFAGSP